MSPDEREAVRRVVGTVARRMLYHLALQRRPEREDDLRDISSPWPSCNAPTGKSSSNSARPAVRDRLRDLGDRYALLSGGDLHPTVPRLSQAVLARRGGNVLLVFGQRCSPPIDQAVASLPRPTVGGRPRSDRPTDLCWPTYNLAHQSSGRSGTGPVLDPGPRLRRGGRRSSGPSE